MAMHGLHGAMPTRSRSRDRGDDAAGDADARGRGSDRRSFSLDWVAAEHLLHSVRRFGVRRLRHRAGVQLVRDQDSNGAPHCSASRRARVL